MAQAIVSACINVGNSCLNRKSLSLSSSSRSSTFSSISLEKKIKMSQFSVRAAEEEVAQPAVDAEEEAPAAAKKNKKIVQVSQKKQLVVLRFLWLEKNIGVGLDQLVPGQGTVPLTPYLFWPRKDAWSEVNKKLEEMPGVSRRRSIILLNQTTDIIDLWQTSSVRQ